jgi:hypothetical protein
MNKDEKEFKETQPETAEQPGRSEREETFSRRALLQAGWTAPIILAVSLPLSAQSASPGHGDTHGDTGEHGDLHSDTHDDVPHNDTVHADHSDATHTDVTHGDANHGDHSDASHTDSAHNDTHNDHTDTTQQDTFTIGYWKAKPELWPTSATPMTLGSRTYSKAQCLVILSSETVSDASLILGRQLIASKLNVANGGSTSINPTIAAADSVIAKNDRKSSIPLKIAPSTTVGQQMVNIALTLDIYNNSEAALDDKNQHNDVHVDVVHVDHTDSAHNDTPPHSDLPHSDHNDATHIDVAHVDSHTDLHIDSHIDIT